MEYKNDYVVDKFLIEDGIRGLDYLLNVYKDTFKAVGRDFNSEEVRNEISTILDKMLNSISDEEKRSTACRTAMTLIGLSALQEFRYYIDEFGSND